jgi:uncharacterized protein YdeI (YjbR/CyaY-like superfamily)
MAAFKQHCAFGFWKHSLVIEGENGRAREAMGSFGRMSSIDDLPSKAVLTRYIKKAMKLNDDGIKAVRDKTPKKKPARMPTALGAALAKNKTARARFDQFSPSQQREYMEWIAEAKGEDTRERRLATAIEWIAEGKTRYWKYAKC